MHSGRWHRKGIEVIYAAENPSLALLETMVHVEEASLLGFDFVAIPIRFDDEHLEALESDRLPEDWKAWPWPAGTQHVGTQWILEQRSVILQVPSVVVPHQMNYLINPSHPKFPELEIGPPEPFPIDSRLGHSR